MFGLFDQQKKTGGLFDLSNINQPMLYAGLGMLSGRNNQEAFGNAAAGALTGYKVQEAKEEKDEKKKAQQALSQYIGAQGLDPNLAAALQANPQMAQAYVSQAFRPDANLTADLREYYAAKKEGFDGNFIEFKRAQAAPQQPPAGFRVTADGGLEPIPGGPADPVYLRRKGDRQNAPAGYEYIDPENPSKGLRAIPGGPGEKIDAEVAARLGLAKSFLEDLPALRKDVAAGKATGLLDHRMGQNGIGEQGRIHARIKSGSDALLRNLTGAGMPESEAARYAARYEPTVWDTSETLISKLDQLEKELRATADVLGRGRGGTDFIPKAERRTSSGVQWRVVQ